MTTQDNSQRPLVTGEGDALSEQLVSFRQMVLERGADLYRDLPWRRSRDPYEVWISEVMLQQTQVSRVDGRWQRWLSRFPSIGALADAEAAEVLDEWQGLGYNRRALSVWNAARQVAEAGGAMPSEVSQLVALPGIGPFLDSVASDFKSKIQQAFGINSPAKIMIPIGESITEGIVVGMGRSAGDITKATNALTSAATTGTMYDPAKVTSMGGYTVTTSGAETMPGGNVITNNITVSGATNPDEYAARLARQIKLQLRTV